MPDLDLSSDAVQVRAWAVEAVLTHNISDHPLDAEWAVGQAEVLARYVAPRQLNALSRAAGSDGRQDDSIVDCGSDLADVGEDGVQRHGRNGSLSSRALPDAENERLTRDVFEHDLVSVAGFGSQATVAGGAAGVMPAAPDGAA